MASPIFRPGARAPYLKVYAIGIIAAAVGSQAVHYFYKPNMVPVGNNQIKFIGNTNRNLHHGSRSTTRISRRPNKEKKGNRANSEKINRKNIMIAKLQFVVDYICT